MDADDEDYCNEKINNIILVNKRIYQLEKDQLIIIQNTLICSKSNNFENKENQDTLAKF